MQSDDRRDLVIVGDPQSRRMPLLLDAAQRQGFDANVVSYQDRHRIVFPNGVETLVRLESPGDSPLVARHILKAGMAPMEQSGRRPIGEATIDALTFGRGEMIHPLQWYLGFQQILQSIQSDWQTKPVRWMNTPAAIATAFDKQVCLDRWAAADLPIAPGYPGIKTYSQLRSTITDKHARVFIKLRYGFSAMGAVALEWRGDLVRAITTAEVEWHAGRPRLFVSKRPRLLNREFEIAWLIDTLAMEEIIVEDWIPKARWRGKPFDLRIVTIGGVAHHVVGRANDSPFSNLNLDAVRIDRQDVADHLGDAWPHVLQLAEQAASHISDGYLGMDILVRPCRKRCVVLEANAFGDNLPRLLYEGETTYDTEMRCSAGMPSLT